MSQATSPSQDPAEGQSHPLIFSRPFACTRCQQRKVKCDRADTCSNCVKGPFDCVYVNPQPAQKRKRKAPADESLSAKLQRYEELLRSNGIEVDETPSETPTHAQGRVKSLLKHNPNKTAPPQPSTQTANLGGDPYAQCRKGKLIAEGDGWRYVEELFWSSGVNDEFRVARPNPTNSGGSSILISFSSLATLSDSHPSETIRFRLWRTFEARVNPLMKIVHSPTMFKLIRDLNTDPESIPKNLEAMLFAIYGAAVMASTDEECMKHFGETRAVLGPKYLAATQRALSLAGVLKSTNLMVLQAFVLSLSTMQDLYDSREMVLLVQMAGHIGIRMGVHRDGSKFALPAYDVEIRRRIWWQLFLLRVQVMRMSGKGHGIDSEAADTMLPLNINDGDFSQESSCLPNDRTGVTEMIFCRAIADMAMFMRKIKKATDSGVGWNNHHETKMPIEARDQGIAEIEHQIEDKYLKYCDPLIPLHVLTTIVMRSTICKLRLMAHYPRGRKSMPQSEKDAVFENAIKIIEYEYLAQTTPTLKQYSWYLKAFTQLEAIMFLVCELRNRDAGELTDRAWVQVENILQCYPDITSSSQNPLYVAMGKIILEAWDTRRSRGYDPPGTSTSFITALQARKTSLEKPERNAKVQPATGSTGTTASDGLLTPASLYVSDDTTAPFDLATPVSYSSDAAMSAEDWAYWDRILQEFQLPPADDFFNSIVNMNMAGDPAALSTPDASE